MSLLRVILFLTACLAHAGVAAAWTQQSCTSPHRVIAGLSAGPSGHDGEIRIDLGPDDFPADYTLSPQGEDVRVLASDDLTPVTFAVTEWLPAARTASLYIRMAPLAANASTAVRIYFGNPALGSSSEPTSVFPDIGLRLHSRSSSVDPVDAATARTAFAAGTDISNAVRASVTGLNNRAIGGAGGDFGWCISAMVEVTPATAGTWEFRYGADFGRGGHLLVAGATLDEQWNDDLWWAGTFANPAQTLEGAINLAPGWHRYEALGFEGCCDGAVGWQARAPGGAWQDFSSANFSLRATQCLVTSVTVTLLAADSCSSTLAASKQVTILSDPVASPQPYAVPGAVVRYEIEVTNPGRAIDDGTLDLRDAIPPELNLIVSGPAAFTFAEGAVPSGLGFSWGGPADPSDSVHFSADGSDFSYIPAPTGPFGSDPAVTHVRFNFSGALAPMSGGAAPSFRVALTGVLE